MYEIIPCSQECQSRDYARERYLIYCPFWKNIRQWKTFLREVQIGSTPCAIVTTKCQLENIVLYCGQLNHFFCVWNWCNLWARLFLRDSYIYRNPSLRNCWTNSEPIFLGPAFIHIERHTQDYHDFFSSHLKYKLHLCNLKHMAHMVKLPLLQHWSRVSPMQLAWGASLDIHHIHYCPYNYATSS